MTNMSKCQSNLKKTNLFLIGAMRAGSTTLYHFLSQHPEIYMSSIKEPDFFVAEYSRRNLSKAGLADADYQKRIEIINNKGKFRTIDKYQQLFRDIKNEKYAGEASHYLYNPGTAHIVYDYNPDSRIIVSLRNPVERIYSEYMYYVRDGRVNVPFNDFLQTGLVWDNVNKKWNIFSESRLNKGFYSKLLKPWFYFFGKEKLKIIVFDQLVHNPMQVCKELYSWLEVDTKYRPEKVHAQRSGKPRSAILYNNIIFQNNFLKNYVKEKLPRTMRVLLRDYLNIILLKGNKMDKNTEILLKKIYHNEIIQLEKMINKDLTSWK